MPPSEKEAFPVHGPRPSRRDHGRHTEAVALCPAPQRHPCAHPTVCCHRGLCSEQLASDSQARDCGQSQIGDWVRCFTGGRGTRQRVSCRNGLVSAAFLLGVSFGCFCFLRRLSTSSLCLRTAGPFVSSVSTFNFLFSFQNSSFAFSVFLDGVI